MAVIGKDEEICQLNPGCTAEVIKNKMNETMKKYSTDAGGLPSVHHLEHCPLKQTIPSLLSQQSMWVLQDPWRGTQVLASPRKNKLENKDNFTLAI